MPCWHVLHQTVAKDCQNSKVSSIFILYLFFQLICPAFVGYDQTTRGWPGDEQQGVAKMTANPKDWLPTSHCDAADTKTPNATVNACLWGRWGCVGNNLLVVVGTGMTIKTDDLTGRQDDKSKHSKMLQQQWQDDGGWVSGSLPCMLGGFFYYLFISFSTPPSLNMEKHKVSIF